MRKLSIVLFLILSSQSIAFAQFPDSLLDQVQQIILLKSNRNDVKRILSKYGTPDDYEHSQEFSNERADIEVTYSSGTCSDDPDSEEASDVWNVPEWTVTRIEITPDEAIKPADLGFDLSKLKKEPRFPDTTDSFVFHDKVLGLAFKTSQEGIEKIIAFPSRGRTKQLCGRMTATKGFYSRKGWFSAERPYDYTCVLQNAFANVVALDLDVAEIETTSSTTISVVTTALDPENDVLTYNYKVSGGRIIGTGAKVVWDLAGLAPGIYTILAGVDDGAGIVGNTITKTVTVK